MQTGIMRILYSAWPPQRLIAAAITLMMLLLAFAAHPPALEAANLPFAQLTHVHDRESKDAGALSHQVPHHDHHVEMISQLRADLLGVQDRPSFVVDQDGERTVQMAFDRPPWTAWR